MVKLEVVFKSGIRVKNLGPLIETDEKYGGVVNISPTDLNAADHLEATTVLISRIAEVRRELEHMSEIDLRRATYERQVQDLVETVEYLNPGMEVL